MAVEQRAALDELRPDLPQLLEVLAWEIELAGARCIFLDKMIGQLMQVTPSEHRAELMEGMHVVDLLSQHLTSLSAFGRVAAQTAEAEGTPSVEAALAQITLGDLAVRMRAAFGAAETDPSLEADSGDLDLF